MGVGDEEPGDEILLARLHAGAALAAAMLRPVGREGHALDVARMADGDDHVLALDQVLVLEIGVRIEDLGSPRRRVRGADLGQLGTDDPHDAGARAQDVEIVGDLSGKLGQLLADLVATERREALQAKVENGARLGVRQAVGAVGVHRMLRVVDQSDQRRDVVGRPVAPHQGLACRIRIGAGADDPDHFVDIGDRGGEAAQDMGALARLGQSRYLVRREITVSRKSTKAWMKSLRFITSGLPPLRATMLAPKFDCSAVKR